MFHYLHETFNRFSSGGPKNHTINLFDSPLSLNTYRYDLYKDHWSHTDILVFESFIVLALKYGNIFKYELEELRKNLRMDYYSFYNTCKKLYNNQSVIHDEQEKTFNINFDRIIERIDNIFDFEKIYGFGTELKEHYIELFKVFDTKSTKKGLKIRGHLTYLDEITSDYENIFSDDYSGNLSKKFSEVLTAKHP